MRLNEFLDLTYVSERYTYRSNEFLSLSGNPQVIFKDIIGNLSGFPVGAYCWFILDHPRNRIHSTGGLVEQLTSYPDDLWVNVDLEKLPEIWHSGDLSHIPFFTSTLHNYIRESPQEERPFIKTELYCRLKESSGKFLWIWLQFFCHFDSLGLPKFTLYFLQDVSHLKKDAQPLMVIRNSFSSGNKHTFIVQPSLQDQRSTSSQVLTPREREVLQCLIQGFCSKQIAAQLRISKNTVENHRQNMLRKTNTQCTAELVALAVQEHFL